MKIRKIVEKDLQEVYEIEQECFPKAEAATYSSLKLRIENFSDSFWILEDNHIVSFINGMFTNCEDLKDEMYETLDDHDPDGDWLMIFGVDTRKEEQHKGYASLLMEAVICDCEERGCKGIVLTCKEGLISFYEKFGYVNEGISNSVHGNVVWYQMRKKLG